MKEGNLDRETHSGSLIFFSFFTVIILFDLHQPTSWQDGNLLRKTSEV
jgi:hypothetical protein